MPIKKAKNDKHTISSSSMAKASDEPRPTLPANLEIKREPSPVLEERKARVVEVVKPPVMRMILAGKYAVDKMLAEGMRKGRIARGIGRYGPVYQATRVSDGVTVVVKVVRRASVTLLDGEETLTTEVDKLKKIVLLRSDRRCRTIPTLRSYSTFTPTARTSIS